MIAVNCYGYCQTLQVSQSGRMTALSPLVLLLLLLLATVIISNAMAVPCSALVFSA